MEVEIQRLVSIYSNIKLKIEIFIKTIYSAIFIKLPWKLLIEQGKIGECHCIIFELSNRCFSATAFNLKLEHTVDKTINVYENKSTSY